MQNKRLTTILGGRVAYRQRVVDDELDDLIQQLPAIALEGARGVGKTSTAERRARTVYRLDDPAHRVVAEADPSLVLAGKGPLLVDEWQRVPSVWDAVRRSVDRDSSPGRFLLTGSAGPKVPPTHSGAGRIASLRMRPLSLLERGMGEPVVSLKRLMSGSPDSIEGTTAARLADYVHEIVCSGFPGIRPLSGRALRVQLDGYLRSIIDVDLPEQGLTVRRPQLLERWLAAYAAATATTASFEAIRDAATGGQAEKPARATTIPYRETLERLWIADPVPAWTPSRNRLSRLGQPPKHHLVDPALAVRMLGLDEDALLRGETAGETMRPDGALLGRLFESLVTQSLRVYAQSAECQVRHFRLHGGRREVDLIVERGDQRALAIEVKLGGAVGAEDVRHLLWLRAQLGDDLVGALVVYTGAHAFRRPDGIYVVPAAMLGP
ncbi:MAG: ATP-binding protein [Candidatus Eisenbacteria bacterium]|nr:ATP-binding protein [Candidatus Eisenbacteria bacterium]